MRRVTADDLRRLARMGPRRAVGRVVAGLRDVAAERLERRRGLRDGTRTDTSGVRVRRRLSALGSEVLDALSVADVAAVAERYLGHRFDLLGSGWVQVRHGVRCPGLEGRRFPPTWPVEVDPDGRWLENRIAGANLDGSKELWRLVDPSYEPIDWHLDFKSGFSWDGRTWHADVRYGDVPGADVKVPWELARGQHLPQLALAHALARSGSGGLRSPEVYVREVRNEILDFCAQNPPGFGVNWACAMDVAIRAVNWLVAVDLLRAHGADLDEPFADEFGRAVWDHAKFVAGNLEWQPVVRANHYLSDVVGLLFCAAYLPRSPQTDAWLAFGVRELVGEVGYQFHPEGTNFEASTAYHRLSTELALYGAALAAGLDEEERQALRRYDHRLGPRRPSLSPPPAPLHPGPEGPTALPAWFVERLERAVEFTRDVTKPDGKVVQVGDNDSGRLLKLRPVWTSMRMAEARARYANLAGDEAPDDEVYWDEDPLDHRHLLSAVGGLIDQKDIAAADGGFEAAVVCGLAGGRRFRSYRQEGASEAEGLLVRSGGAPPDRPADRDEVIEVPGGAADRDLETAAYPDFGLYVFRTPRMMVTVRCGRVGQKGNGGHAHNDQLAVTVTVDGEEVIPDPGTYLYTPLPDHRNAYRSVRAHHAPQVAGREPGRLDLGLFTLPEQAFAECLSFGPRGFVGHHSGFGAYVYRRVRVEPEGVRISDWAEGGLRLVDPPPPPPPSPGYGRILREGRGAVRGAP